eukprot:TRINITY_DN4558_c0_g1_i3.p1 TRINITY_DN4558_c0_g1~~TRINITY_DN4558_c0_g1_i3.p1  ORF type:complete len:214 (-),score=40.54 TRINITY_DN4558_c0_g1_i3:116-757(-)
MAKAKPTASHLLCTLLQQKGILQRVYTQNVDGLYAAAGVREDLLVEAHGSVRKNNIVLYEDSLPAEFYAAVAQDFPQNARPPDCVDLMLVMGTSLQVAPFCAVPNLGHRHCMRVLVTKDVAACTTNPFSAPKKWSDEALAMYSESRPAPSLKFGSRAVSLQSWWGKRRWKSEFLVDMDTDLFTQLLVRHCGWTDEFAVLCEHYSHHNPSSVCL